MGCQQVLILCNELGQLFIGTDRTATRLNRVRYAPECDAMVCLEVLRFIKGSGPSGCFL